MEKNNLLNKTSCYTIGHMQYYEGRSWRNYVKEQLIPLGIRVYDPYEKPFINAPEEDEVNREKLLKLVEDGQFDAVTKHMKSVRRFDLSLVDISSFLISHIVPHVASWGSAEELSVAVRMKRPVFLSVEGGKKKTPLWIFSMIPHAQIFDSVEESVNIIKDIDAGKIPIDMDRWRLLKPEFR